MLRRAILFAALFLVTSLPSSFVCDVHAQSRAPGSSLTHVDTALFNGDTILLHSAPANAKLAVQFGQYIAAMQALPGIPTSHSPSVIDVFVARNEAEFARLTGGAAPHWGAGVAQPDSGIIVIPGYTSKRAGVQDLGPVIRHEIAHVELQRALPGMRIPRWFTEGYAVWSAGQLDPDADWYLRLAFMSKRAPPLDSLEIDWPAAEMDARVAYLLSASAVAYLHSLGPDSMFAAFITRWNDNGSFEQAIRTTYLISGVQFERLWSKHVRRHYGWLLFLAQGVVVWAFVTMIAVALIFFRRRRDRRRLAELRRNEIPDDPAYWQDPPPEALADTMEGAPEPPAG